MPNPGSFTHQLLCAKATNKNYHVIIRCPGQGVEITADMPEEVATAVGSEWENKLPSSLADFSAGLNSAAKNILGTSAQLQYATEQVWVNSSPIELPLTLVFDAVDKGGYEEVIRPIRVLESLTMPMIGWGGILYAPGPGSGNSLGCIVQVGRQMQVPDMILISAQSSFSSRLDSKGHPIAGRIDCVFRTNRVIDRDTWMQYTVGHSLKT
jgi:hypothetical protein